MNAIALPYTNESRINHWILLIAFEIICAFVAIQAENYAIPIFLIGAFLIVLFSWPEFAYGMFILSLICHLVQFQIEYAHSPESALWRIHVVPVDIAALRSIVTNLFVLAAAFSWFLSIIAKARAGDARTKIDFPVTVFLLWFFISLAWTPDLSSSLVVAFALGCSCTGFYLSVRVIRTRKILNVTIWLIIVNGIINASIAAYSLHAEPFFEYIYRGENCSAFINFINTARERGMGLAYCPMTAYFLNVSIMMSIAMLLITKKAHHQFLLVLIILFLLYGHLSTVAKGGFIGLMAGLSCMGVFSRELRKHPIIFVATVVCALILVASAIYLSWPWPEKAQFLRGRQSLSPRMIIWTIGVEEFIKSNGLGYGGGHFYPAHSIYFQVLFALGIPGLIIWFWMLSRFFLSISATLSKPVGLYYKTMLVGLTAATISILTVGLVDSFYFEDTMWTLFGISMAAVNLANRSFMKNMLLDCDPERE